LVDWSIGRLVDWSIGRLVGQLRARGPDEVARREEDLQPLVPDDTLTTS